MNNSVVLQERGEITATDVRLYSASINEVIKEVMLPEVHYGKIPGCGDKQVLLKAGAEKIFSRFGIVCEPENIEDLSNNEEVRYRVKEKGIVYQSGKIIGYGIGECSSAEDKFCWREAITQEEWDETPEHLKRKLYKKGYNKPNYTVLQIKTNHKDKANTVLKMAVKRAKIDLCLSCFGCSDIFLQDEDFQDAQFSDAPVDEPKTQPKQASPTRKSETAKDTTEEKEASIDVESIGYKPTNNGGKRYTIRSKSGEIFSTFSDTFAELIKESRDAGKPSSIKYKTTQYGNEITVVAL
jgi:hypothetical protein